MKKLSLAVLAVLSTALAGASPPGAVTQSLFGATNVRLENTAGVTATKEAPQKLELILAFTDDGDVQIVGLPAFTNNAQYATAAGRYANARIDGDAGALLVMITTHSCGSSAAPPGESATVQISTMKRSHLLTGTDQFPNVSYLSALSNGPTIAGAVNSPPVDGLVVDLLVTTTAAPRNANPYAPIALAGLASPSLVNLLQAAPLHHGAHAALIADRAEARYAYARPW